MRLGKLGVPMIMLLLLVSGCGMSAGDTQGDNLRSDYARLASFAGTAQVTADYGTRVYQYTIETEGTLTEGRLTVTEPEALAGTGFSWSGGEGVVSYGDVTLETGKLSADGLSPADAVAVVMDALARGSETRAGQETLNGVRTAYFQLSNPSWPDSDSSVLAWLDLDTGALLRGEVQWEGTTVITLDFLDFTFETTPEEE